MKRGESEDSPQFYLYDIKSLGQSGNSHLNCLPCHLYALESERKDGKEENHMCGVLPAEAAASNRTLIVAHLYLLW
jgi:hypothetical protein